MEKRDILKRPSVQHVAANIRLTPYGQTLVFEFDWFRCVDVLLVLLLLLLALLLLLLLLFVRFDADVVIPHDAFIVLCDDVDLNNRKQSKKLNITCHINLIKNTLIVN